MANLITFVTNRFDPAKETPNDINPIAGEAVLLWLRQRLTAEGYDITKPATEDWGWYVTASKGGATYMIGASGEPEEANPEVHWTIQFEKTRSLKDRLFGKNKLAADDALVRAVERLLRGEADFRDVSVDTGV